MKTDKQVYKILESRPQWFFDLTQIESPGPCAFRSIALKEVEVTADGVIEPELPEKTWFVVEFQAQYDPSVYIRLALEMALFQKQHLERLVEGVIIFLDEGMDPKTEPWSRIVRTFTLTEQLAELERIEPNHPLIAVFAPLTITEDNRLESAAAACYNRIMSSELDERIRSTLADTFVSWLVQRFVDKGKPEIEEMLIGALPELSETQSGKDLIAIGERKGIATGIATGKAEGKRESLLLILLARFGDVPPAVEQSLMAIESVDRLDQLIQQASKADSIEDLTL